MSIWSRKKMKETGKIRMRGNYWKAVLAAIIITFAAGSAGMAGGASVGSSSGASDSTESVESSESSYSSENTMGNMEAEETTDDEISVISLKIPSLTVRKRKNRCIPCGYWAAAIFAVVTDYSILFFPFTFFLNISHFTFCYELIICSETTDVMKIIRNSFSFV